MRIADKHCLVCSCEGTMVLDAKAIAVALDADAPPRIHHQLCRGEIDRLSTAVAEPGELVIACAQESALFEELATGPHAAASVRAIDIRNAAGWSKAAGDATPKIAALLAQATLTPPASASVALTSRGRCLIAGDAEVAIAAAERLARALDVTLLLTAGDALPPRARLFALLRGTITCLAGHLGNFRVAFGDLAMLRPAARDRLEFAPPKADSTAEFDIVVDLRGDSPLVQAPEKRDGYLRADPGDRLAVERALFDAAQLTGDFEKPRYVQFDASICAHSRAGQVGCHRCLDHCPTGAITPAGEHVTIDPFVCAGCGACAALCPSGAATYAAPSPNHQLERLRALATTYQRAGGASPRLLVHDERHGADLIDAMARYGDGLPADVIPFALAEPTQLGLEFFATALAYGFTRIDVLLPWRKAGEALALETNIAYAEAVLDGLGLGSGRVALLFEDDPDPLAARLWDGRPAPIASVSRFLPLGGKRERQRMALDALHAASPTKPDAIAMPAEAPLGRIVVDVDGCTLCLACVGACPTGALIDNPDQPMVRFIEDACIQCGLCRTICPEKVIRLEPRISFHAAAKSPQVIKQEEPATCPRCGKSFGTRSTIDRIVRQLASKHSMFQTAARIESLRMCEDCRVAVQFEVEDNPLAAGPRPAMRTTDDYLRERDAIEAARRRLEDRSDD